MKFFYVRPSVVSQRRGKADLALISLIVAIISAVVGAFSVWYAWRSSNAAWNANQISIDANKIATDALQKQSTWHTGDLHDQLLQLLSELNYQEAEASRLRDDQGCTEEEVCLGGLAFTDESLRRYESVTMHALSIANQLSSDLDAAVWLELADSTYVTGRLDKTIELVNNAKRSSDYLVQYRSELLLAQCAFMRRQLDDGINHVKNSLKIIEDARSSMTGVELAMRQARAHLTCGSMHLTLGKRDEALKCIRTATTAIESLPDIRRRADLLREVDGLLVKYANSAYPSGNRSFDEMLNQAEDNAKEAHMPGSIEPAPAPVPAEAGT